MQILGQQIRLCRILIFRTNEIDLCNTWHTASVLSRSTGTLFRMAQRLFSFDDLSYTNDSPTAVDQNILQVYVIVTFKIRNPISSVWGLLNVLLCRRCFMIFIWIGGINIMDFGVSILQSASVGLAVLIIWSIEYKHNNYIHYYYYYYFDLITYEIFCIRNILIFALNEILIFNANINMFHIDSTNTYDFHF